MNTTAPTNGKPCPALEAAHTYLDRGLCPIPIPYQTKAPVIPRWQNLRLRREELAERFNGRSNVGVLLGEPSGNLIDVDLDHPSALALAGQYLPPTPAIFGRPGNPSSHRLYKLTRPAATTSFAFPDSKAKPETDSKKIVEFRSTGAQTVFPGSVHTSGERIEWETDGEPALVDPDELLLSVEALADEVRRRFGYEKEPAPAAHSAAQGNTAPPPDANDNVVDRARKYLAKIPPAVSGSGGHNVTFYAAYKLVQGFGLSREQALQLLGEWNQSCQPPWSDKELAHKIDSALKEPGERGYMLGADRRHESNGKPHNAKPLARPKNGDSGADNELPTIDATIEDLAEITPMALAAIERSNNPPTIFRFGGIASRIEPGDGGVPAIRDLNQDRMRHLLARVAKWSFIRKVGDNEIEKLVAPPMAVVRDVLATPDPPLPKLSRIVEAPVFAPDGTLQTTAGYHPAGKIFYAPAAGFAVPPVSEHPTPAEIKDARTLLAVELLGEFPFVGESELANTIGFLLLPFARDLIDGPTPLHLFEKPSAGTGATLLVDVTAYPSIGRPIAAMTEGRDEDEWRKRVFAKLMSGSPYAFIDNLRRRLDSAAVASAITSKTSEDRILGASTIVQVPVRCVWCASGNNPAVSSEIARRTVRIRMDAKQDRPWLRTGFRHPDLRGWATANRPRLVWAALTLIRAWLAAGRPEGNQTLGMFEPWAKTIGGILDVAGIPGFLANLDEFYTESDAEGATWRTFLAGWWAEFAGADVLVKDLWKLATEEASIGLGDGGEQSQRIVLGKMLAERRDRVFEIASGDQRLRLRIKRGGTVRRATVWSLEGTVSGVSV